MQNVTLTQQEKKEVYLETNLGNIVDMLQEVIDNIDYNEDKELYWTLTSACNDISDYWQMYYKLNQKL